MSEEEFKNLKKEVDDLRKQKIIMQAKLKQKEDQVNDLTKKFKDQTSKEGEGDKGSSPKVQELESELEKLRKTNKSLRDENANLEKQLEDAKKATAEASSKAVQSETVALQKVSVPGSQPKSEPNTSDEVKEELEFLREELNKKDKAISKLSEQLQSFDEQQAQMGGGASYSKIRQMDAKLREMKNQLEVAKKSENEMKDRLIKMQRQLSARDEETEW